MSKKLLLLSLAAALACAGDPPGPRPSAWAPACVDSVAYREVYADGYSLAWEGFVENTAVHEFGWLDGASGQFRATGSTMGAIRIDSAGVDLGTRTGVVSQGGVGLLGRLAPDTIVFDYSGGYGVYSATLNRGAGPAPDSSTWTGSGPEYGGWTASLFIRWSASLPACGIAAPAALRAASSGPPRGVFSNP